LFLNLNRINIRHVDVNCYLLVFDLVGFTGLRKTKKKKLWTKIWNLQIDRWRKRERERERERDHEEGFIFAEKDEERELKIWVHETEETKTRKSVKKNETSFFIYREREVLFSDSMKSWKKKKKKLSSSSILSPGPHIFYH